MEIDSAYLSHYCDLCNITVLRGVKKSQNNMHKERLPITHDILKDMITSLKNGLLGQYDSLMLAAACSMAFYGFLRCGEFTVSGALSKTAAYALKINDVTFEKDKSGYVLNLKNSNADVFRSGVKVTVAATGSTTCPLQLLDEYINLRFKCGASLHDPLFINSCGKTLTREFFITSIRKLLRDIGKTPDFYSGHSFRIGAATTAAKVGIEDHLVKTLGRWTSGCYSRYIRTNRKSIHQAQNAMCRVES
ncbi:uncharacterized protein LOC128545832 [Mercenaria mercenaria]|uniref:uncharacterized protein LOC128545832 n=1 Tax=Mercenaria mercenaria TaxID=6596 RepID=UPI001E1E0EBA|nr:uncharacterized protein LOC128545832 [Mercenaria mercenaria]